LAAVTLRYLLRASRLATVRFPFASHATIADSGLLLSLSADESGGAKSVQTSFQLLLRC
jgi:hypothetical protein